MFHTESHSTLSCHLLGSLRTSHSQLTESEQAFSLFSILSSSQLRTCLSSLRTNHSMRGFELIWCSVMAMAAPVVSDPATNASRTFACTYRDGGRADRRQ